MDPVAVQLAQRGLAIVLETRGRRSGLPARTAIGFIEDAGGSLLVAAGPGAHWARNLEQEPACRVTFGDRTAAAMAEPLFGDERAAVIRELILKYGAPSERLGAGPAFRLRLIDRPQAAPDRDLPPSPSGV